MKIFELRRVSRGAHGCFGVLVHNGIPFAVTLEATYLPPEAPWQVKIPAGVYTCKREMYNKGGYPTYEIPVQGHSEIKFHRGNYRDDTDGCPLIGLEYDGVHIRFSREGFNRFMMIANGDAEIALEVYDEAGWKL